MKVIDPGHVFLLDHLDGDGKTELRFVKREGPGYPFNVGRHEGTNIQEVIRALIERVSYLNHQIKDESNKAVIRHLRMALMCLESRAARRHGRELDVDLENIERQPVHDRCGHIGCLGNCHPNSPQKTESES